MILLLILLSFSGAANPRGIRGTPGNRKHKPTSHYLHYFHIIIQYDITIIPTIIFRGCESSWDTGGTWEPQTHAYYFSLNLDNLVLDSANCFELLNVINLSFYRTRVRSLFTLVTNSLTD